MSHGRRDYTWGFLDEAASEGRYNETYSYFNDIIVDPVSTANIWDYTVPVGCLLALTRISICSESKIMNGFGVYINGAIVFAMLFDSGYSFIVSDKNSLYVKAGEHVYVSVENNDEIAQGFFVNVTGVLEQI